MQRNLLWTGREYYSLENCVVDKNAEGILVDSVIVGKYRDTLYRVQYHLRIDEHWQTLFAEIHGQYDNRTEHLVLKGDGKGNWTKNGQRADEFTGCIDIDLPLTPFTNTLPVNRLKLAVGEERRIKVIYLDVLEKEIKAVEQQYTRLSATSYHYENVPNDFEADIEVDEWGLVVDYPELFVRSADTDSTYNFDLTR